MDLPLLQTYDIFGKPQKVKKQEPFKAEDPLKLAERIRAKRVPYYKPEELTPARWDTLSWWEKPIDVLMRPSYAAVGLVTGVIKGDDPLGRAAKGFTGEKPYTFTEELFKESPWYVKYPLGLGLDIITDPVTYVTAGSVKAMSMSTKGVSKAVPPVMRLSEEGTKVYRNVEAALTTAAQLKHPTPAIADTAKDIMRYIVERPMIEKAKDMAGLTRFDREIGSTIPEHIRRLQQTGVLKELPALEKMIDPKGLRLSIPLLRDAIGEPMIVPGRAAEKVLEVPGAALGLAWRGAKKIPGVGTVAKMTELAAESASQGLKGWFKQASDYAAADDVMRVADADLARDLRKLAEDTQKRAKRFEEIVAKAGGDREAAKKAYRDVMTHIEETVQTLPDDEARAFAQRRLNDVSAKFQAGEAIFKKKSMKLSERKAKLNELAAKLGDVESTDPFGIAERIGFSEYRGGRWAKKAVEERAAQIAREEQAVERAGWKDQADAIYGEMLEEMGVPKIWLGKETTKKMKGLYGALPKDLRSPGPMIGVQPDELAAMLTDRGIRNVTTGEEALEKYVEMLAATGKMRAPKAAAEGRRVWWPKHLRGRPDVTTDHRVKAAQSLLAEQIAKRTGDVGEASKTLEARWTKERGDLERMLNEYQNEIQNATKQVTVGRGLTAEEIIAARTAENVEIPWLKDLDPKFREMMAEDRRMYDEFFGKLEQLDKGVIRKEGYLPLQMTPMLRNAWINSLDELKIKDRVLRVAGSGQHARHRLTEYTIDQGALMDWVKENRVNLDKLLTTLKKNGMSEDQVSGLRVWIDDPVQLAHQYATSVTRVVHRERVRNALLEKFQTARLDPDDPEFFNLANRILFEEKDSALFLRVRHAPGLEIDAVALSRANPEESLQKLVSLKDKIVDKTVYVIPEEISDAITKLYQVTRSDAAWNEFLRGFDEFQGLWKASVTVMFPSFHSRNLASNPFMLFIGGVALAALPGKLWKGFTMFRLWNKKKFDKLDNILIKSSTGVTYTGRWAAEQLDRHGMLRTLMDQELEEFNRVMAASDRPSVQAANKMFKVGQMMNEYVDNSAKMALFVDQIEKGADVSAAIQHVRLHLYGPQQLTDMEKNVFRRLIPFYSWLRFSIPFAVRTLSQHPGEFAVVGKALNVAKKEEEALDKSAVPEWIASSAGVEVKREGKTHYFFVLENWLPTADLLKFGNAPQEFLSALTPAIRLPIEMMTNISTGDMKELERFSGEKKRFLGTALNAKAVQILRNIRILNEIDRLFFRPEMPLTDRLAATIGGFRLYPVDEEYAYKRVLYDKQREGSNIKQAMNRIKIQLGDEHPEYIELAERLSGVKQEQKDLRQRITQINPLAWAREKAS